MRIHCNKFPDTVIVPEIKNAWGKITQQKQTELSCRFYAFPEGKDRVKVQVDGKVDFLKVTKEFADKGIAISTKELQDAYDK